MKRRMLISLLILSVAIAAFSPGQKGQDVYAASVNDFADVATGYWGRDYIDFAVQAGIINGYPPSADGRREFRPESKVSMEESMQMLYKAVVNSGTRPELLEGQTEKYEKLLTDNSIAIWAWDCVIFGLENGILEEMELVVFRSESNVPATATREQVAKWSAKALLKEPLAATSLDYPDKNQIAAENLIHIDLLNRMSIMVGDNMGMFNPKAAIKRVEFAAICSRIYDLAATPYASEREYRSFSGTVTGSSSDTGKIFLKTLDGAVRVIDVEALSELVIDGRVLSYTEGLSSIKNASNCIVAIGTYGQIHIQTQVLLSEGTLTAITTLGGAEKALSIRVQGGTAIYIMDEETILIDPLKLNKTIRFISDGIKLIETADPI